MAKRYIEMSGKEFINKFIAGERDFSGIRLPPYTDFSGEEFQPIRTPYEGRIILRDSSLGRLVAPGIWFRQADLSSANLSSANLRFADLSSANLTQVIGIEKAENLAMAVILNSSQEIRLL